jgi:hypothetical protein
MPPLRVVVNPALSLERGDEGMVAAAGVTALPPCLPVPLVRSADSIAGLTEKSLVISSSLHLAGVLWQQYLDAPSIR